MEECKNNICHKDITIKYGDVKDFIKNIPSNSIDLIVTDPPYKLNKTTGSSTSSSMESKWQGNLKAGDKNANIQNTIKFKEWLLDAYRVLKDNSHCYIFTNDKNLNDLINEALKVGFKLHNILVWKKNNKTPNRWYMKNCEFIVFLHKGKSIPINNKSSCQLLDYNNINGKHKLHPTEKPVDMLKELILNSVFDENSVVLDMFMGSGSTGVACKELGIRFIGFEIDENHFNVAKNRIKNV
jgi:site-specific DNA-methyltransferase (adenine-specific)